jgi:flagellin
MIINHNIPAMNAQRHFGLNVRRMDSNLESLSSGLRINQAADDAAGLAVSEKMRAQIRGLNQASRNLQDGISLVQTAEGYLKESGDVLQRIRELTVQAANGTYTNEDRSQISVEIDELVKELNRIHEDGKFNTMRLLDGKSTGFNSFGVDAANLTGNQVANNWTSLGPENIATARNVNFNVTDTTQTPPVATDTGMNGVVIQSGANTDERMFIELGVFNTYALGITAQPINTNGDPLTYNAAADLTQVTDPQGNPLGSDNFNLAWREFSFYQPEDVNLDAALYLETAIQGPANGEVNIQFLNPLEGNRLDVSSSERATASISVADVALNKVNKQRADIGAFQNRMELAMEGVDNAAENLQAAESRIRDADMAKQFVEFTKNQILSQSAASMTAQANVRSQLIMRIIG